MTLGEIRKDRDLVNAMDWEMTPEEAVVLYLEWGNNWSHGRMVKSKHDIAYYFVVNTWDVPPKVYLIRRGSDQAVELAAFELPNDMGDRFLKWAPDRKGVYPLNEEVKAWLKRRLNA